MLNNKYILFLVLFFIGLPCNSKTVKESLPKLQLSENKRFFVTEKGTPFFWLADTGWLLFSKLSREESEKYFEDRHQKGFNVIQVMVLHDIKKEINFYGDSALINSQIDRPPTTPGNSPDNPVQYDYWDHMDYVINLAEKKGLYVAMVPIWGSNVRNGGVSKEQAARYSSWLAERYKNKSNVIWLNGGDVKGSDSIATWQIIGSTIKKTSPD